MPEGGHPSPEIPPSTGRGAILATLCLAIVALGAMLREIGGVASASWVVAPFLPAYLTLRWSFLRNSARALVLATAAIGLVAFLRLDADTMGKAIDRAVYFPAFLILLGLLREAAALSPTVISAGRFLIAQPPGRRYLALTAGGQVFGVLLNLGGFALLLDMLKRANTLQAAKGQPDVVAIRERRMVIATLRGFLAAPFWSPLAVSMALVLASVPKVSWSEIAPVGILIALAYMALGWLFDRVQSPPRRIGFLAQPEPGGLRAFMGVAAHVVALAGATVAMELLTHLAFQKVLLIVVPLYAVGWAILLMRGFGLPATIGRAFAALGRGAATSYPRYANEVAIFATSTFLGVVLAASVPVPIIDSIANAATAHPSLVAPTVCLATVAFSVIGINPMITVAIVATALGGLSIPGLSPRELALTLCGSWAMSVGVGPFISTTVMIAGVFCKPLTTIAWRWNGAFGVTAIALFCLLLYLVEF